MANSKWVTSVHSIEAQLRRSVPGELLLEKGHKRAGELRQLPLSDAVKIREVSREELRRTVKDAKARIAAFLPVSGRSSEAGKTGFRLTDFLPPGASDVLVALDQVTDQRNIGAIIRSADRFGVRGVFYPQRGSAAPKGDSDILRASAGTAAGVAHGSVVNLSRTLKELAAGGYWIYGAEARGANIRSARINLPAVIVFGSEHKGLRPNVQRACDMLLSIPGGGFADSLNVSVAAGIMLYEITGRKESE